MSLGNTTLWGNVLPGGVAGELPDGGVDTTQVIDDLLATLHAGSRADLTFWTEGQLIQWMDEAVKRLARIACVFVGRWASTLTVSGQASYTLPLRHVATLHQSYLAAQLRPSGTMELEARDPAYQTTTGTPAYWYEDLIGNLNIALAPVPNLSDQAIPMIYEGWPPELDAGRQNTLVSGPPPLKGYLAMCVLAAAYGIEGEMEMPDLAAHCRARCEMYEKVFVGLYGKGM